MRYYHEDDEIAEAISKLEGRGVTPDAVFVARDSLGLKFPLGREELARIRSRLVDQDLPQDRTARSYMKAVQQSYREARERSRRHARLTERARRDLFGSPAPPFSSLDAARQWIKKQQSVMRPIYSEHYKTERTEGWHAELLAWPGEGGGVARSYVDKDGPLARLSRWSDGLAREAGLMVAQATACILIGDIGGAEDPVTAEVKFHREREPEISINAFPYVPKRVVSTARHALVRLLTGRTRSRPGPKQG